MRGNFLMGIKRIHRVFHAFILLFCFTYLVNSCASDYKPLEIAPIYKDTIKAIDPLEYLKNGLGAKDFAEY